MEEYFDEACLIALCCLAIALGTASPFGVIGLLAAIIIVCAQNAVRPLASMAAQTAFALAACLSEDLFAFLPVAAYAMLHGRAWPIRLGWLLPVLCQLAHPGPSASLAAVCVLLAVAAALAIKDRRVSSERVMTRSALDALRERTRTLASEEDADRTEAPHMEGSAELLAGLTERERAVCRLVAEGMDNREISRELFLSEGTVRNHISSILQKKSLANRTQIAVRYYNPRWPSGGSIG